MFTVHLMIIPSKKLFIVIKLLIITCDIIYFAFVIYELHLS